MKIAILLPGLIRTFKESPVLDSFNKSFKSHDIDVFSSIWDIKGNISHGSKSYTSNQEYINQDKILDSDISFIKEKFNIKSLKIDSYDEWSLNNEEFLKNYDTKHPNSGYQMTKNGIFSQYYQILESFKLIPNVDDYDVVVKSRYDIEFNTINFDDIKFDNDTYYTGKVIRNDNIPTDFLFFGTSSFIKKFMNIYDYIKNVEPYNPNDIHRVHHTYTPEIMTKKFLIDNGFSFENLNFNAIPVR